MIQSEAPIAQPKSELSKTPAVPDNAGKTKEKRGASKPAAPQRPGRSDTKQARMIALLKRESGATIGQLAEALGWQAHSIRGAISGLLKKKLGLKVTSRKNAAGVLSYRIR